MEMSRATLAGMYLWEGGTGHGRAAGAGAPQQLLALPPCSLARSSRQVGRQVGKQAGVLAACPPTCRASPGG